MRKLGFTLNVLTVLAILAVGCKPSYGLTIHVTDSSGNMISRAQVALTDIMETQTVDSTGQVSWQHLVDSTVNLIVWAEGYTSMTTEITLKPGDNKVLISLAPQATEAVPPGP